MALFEIKRWNPSQYISRILNVAAPRGTPIGPHDTDPTAGQLAQPTKYLGVLLRDCTTTGPVLADHVYPGRLELPYKVGDAVSLAKVQEIEVEGPPNNSGAAGNSGLLVTAGTGAISATDAVGTAISCTNGQYYKAQATDQVFFRISARGADLTPDVGGNIRIRLEANNS